MKRPADEQMVQDYLLGILPEAEMERLDALSVVDEDFASDLNAAEFDLIDSYVRGELPSETVDLFQSNYLASPRRREKVTFARTFHDRLQQEQTPPVTDTSWKSRLFKFFAVPNLPLQWGFAAAALLLLIAGGYLIQTNLNLRNQIRQTGAEYRAMKQREQGWQNRTSQRRSSRRRYDSERERLQQKIEDLEQQLAQKNERQEVAPQNDVKLLAFNLAPQARGISKLPVLAISPQTDFVTLTLEIEVNEFPSYHVALKSPGTGEILWRSGKIKANDENNSVLVGLPANIFHTQNYLLEVSGVSANGTEVVGGYPFRVVMQ